MQKQIRQNQVFFFGLRAKTAKKKKKKKKKKKGGGGGEKKKKKKKKKKYGRSVGKIKILLCDS